MRFTLPYLALALLLVASAVAGEPTDFPLSLHQWTAPSSINVGPDMPIRGTKPITYDGAVNTQSRKSLPRESFNTAREGKAFSLTFTLPAGTYDILLGFAELRPNWCKPGARVFNVFLNDAPLLESFDVFATSKACYRATTQRFLSQTVDPVLLKPLVLRFEAISFKAMLSHVRVKRSKRQCKPVTDNVNYSDDHLAHAVPGEYPPDARTSYIDISGRGSVSVLIDGTASHTHFYYNGGTGKIKSYEWTLPDTRKLITSRAKFRRDFPLGTTRLRLSVVDTVCSKNDAETTVTVTGIMREGAYCYFYKELPEMLAPGSLLDDPHPSFALVANNINFRFPDFPFKDTAFSTRCLFFVDFAEETTDTIVAVVAGRSGNVRAYRGSELLIDLATSGRSAPQTFSAGLQAFEVIYHHTNMNREPTLGFKINGKYTNNISHDRSTVLPIITKIDPPEGTAAGDVRTKIEGYGLYMPISFSFGSMSVRASALGSTPTSVVVFTPKAGGSNVVSVKARSRNGYMSNSLQYIYGGECDPVAFELKPMKSRSGGNVGLQTTCVALWTSNTLYLGSREGIVRQLVYDTTNMRVRKVCRSPALKDPRYMFSNTIPSARTILGITFDPRDLTPRPYVSVSTLFWERQRTIQDSTPRRWANGAVERLELVSNRGLCLKWDKRIVSNLPVPDGDHAINELVFTQSGDLLIAVGGFTNAGLPLWSLGGNWESFYSGAVLRAKLSLGDAFNGEVEYDTPDNLRTAKPLTNDVELYATGVRNLFSMVMGRSGEIFGLDMGTNCAMGNVSSSCDEYVEADAKLRSSSEKVPFPGKAIVSDKIKCKYGDSRKDKLIQIKEGKYYGHSNLQRAALTNEDAECVWIDPKTGLSPPPKNDSPPGNYEHNMGLFRSPMTGLREYASNLFCGKLRGDFILSRYKGQATFRVRRLANGSIEGGMEQISETGGMRVEENARGDLIFPRYQEAGINVLRPKVATNDGLFVANAVPLRHGREGGKVLTVGGWGFGSGTRVFVGSQECVIQNIFPKEILCIVPAFVDDSELVDVKVERNGVDSVLPGAVMYMSV